MASKIIGPLAYGAIRVAQLGRCEMRLCTGAISAASAPMAIALGARLVMGCAVSALA